MYMYAGAEEAERRLLLADLDEEEMSLHPESHQNEVEHNEMSILHIWGGYRKENYEMLG